MLVGMGVAVMDWKDVRPLRELLKAVSSGPPAAGPALHLDQVELIKKGQLPHTGGLVLKAKSVQNSCSI